MPTVAMSKGQNQAPAPSMPWSSRTTPKPSAPRAMAGPASTSRRTRRGRAPRRLALETGRCLGELLVGGEHHPEAGVHRQARAAQGGGDDERHAHPQHGQAEVGGQPGSDAADHAFLRVAGRPAEVETLGTRLAVGARRWGVEGGSAAHRVSIVANEAMRAMRQDPDGTLTAPGRGWTPTRGEVRVVPDGVRRRGRAGLGP